MVNIKGIVYIGNRLEITAFNSPGEFIAWQVGRRPDQLERDRFNNYYSVTCKVEEEHLENKYNLDKGALTGAMLIFRSALRAEKYLTYAEVTKTITDKDHIIIVEVRPSKHYNVATFYTGSNQFVLIVNFNDPIGNNRTTSNLVRLTSSFRNS